MTLMHRYLLRQFLVAYLACFVSLFLIYLVLDVFTKMDEFAVDPHRRQTQAARTTAPDADPLLVETKTERAAARASLPTFFQNMVNYYWYRAPLFFDRVNAFIALLGATFSLGWLQRQNEFLPLFAAGVSLRRLLLPLWILLALIVALGAAGREWVIPACAPFLLREAEDPLGRRPLLVQGCFDEHDIHVEGRVAYPDRKMIQHARLTLPATP
ncbi:MAG TPA: LptF/LptG family permease, partial [Gemmatales bacterium]|nr:LptF/LptG family permease [Gemmatales bacterium]